MKMLATSAVYADEILIGNLTPIADKFKSEAITAALPLNAPGVSLWSRQPYAQNVAHEADYPLSYRFDETDSVLVCDRVENSVGAGVPAQRRRDVAAHLHRDAGELLPEPSFQHPLLVEDGPDRGRREPRLPGQRHRQNSGGARDARALRRAGGDDRRPGARARSRPGRNGRTGYATPNRRIMYAALNWCQEHHTEIVDMLRTLLGGIPLLMPAGIDVMTDAPLRDTFERWWKTPSIEAVDRHKLYKLAWDIVGSEFAGRHMLYEKFYAGNSLVVRNQSDREAPWDRFHAVVDGLLDGIDDTVGRRRRRQALSARRRRQEPIRCGSSRLMTGNRTINITRTASDIRNGTTPRNVSTIGTSLASELITNTFNPTGGVISPISTTLSVMMPNQILRSSGFRPKSSAATIGQKIGMVIRIMASESMTQPSTR